jgi:hypothetical protein
MADLFVSAGGGAASGAAAGTAVMPGWGTAIGAGLGALGGIFSWMGSQDQAAKMRAQAEEELRRKKAADEQRLGVATAAGMASGVEADSPSLQAYLSSMQAEMKRQQDWMRKAGAANAGAVSTAGDIGLFTNLGGTLFNYAKQNNWWKGAGG